MRVASNLLAVVALLLLADWLLGWWRGDSTYACTAVVGLGSEAALTLVGMGGLLIAILGITLGGVRHPMTATGLVVLAVGMLALPVLGSALANTCG